MFPSRPPRGGGRKRDHYEGTPWDLTAGPAAGPFGNPVRYDAGVGPDGGVGAGTVNELLDADEALRGKYPRAISIARTSWSIVAQGRASLPDAVGGVLWYTQYAPHASAYVPLYAGAAGDDVPPELASGSLYRHTRGASPFPAPRAAAARPLRRLVVEGGVETPPRRPPPPSTPPRP